MSEIIFSVLLISFLLGVESFPHEETSLGIVGGETINITEAPFMARYGNLGIFGMCGAAIVHARFVISLAYCYTAFKVSPQISYVLVGTDDIMGTGQLHSISKSYPHPKYEQYSGLDYDIVLLELEDPMKLNKKVFPIQLAEKDFVVPEGAELDTFGFGAYNYTNDPLVFEIPDKLQKISLPFVSNDECKKSFLNLTDRMICTYSKGVGPCLMDDGGPLVYNNTLVGVSSYAWGCGVKDNQNIFSYIPALRDFIDDIIQNSA